MAYKKTSIVKTSAGATGGALITWTRIEPATGCYLDLNGVNSDRLVLIVAHGDTGSAATTAGRALYIGSSSTADSATTKLLYSAGKREKVTLTTHGDTLFKLDSRDAGDSGIYAINILGPFESAKVKDTDGYMNVGGVIGGTTTTLVAAVELV